MRTTAIMNLKGGVGKTTTTVNMAAILADIYKKQVVVVDGDSQCNTTEFLSDMVQLGTLADALRGHRGYVINTNVHGVKLLPGDDSLMDLDLSSIESKKLDILCLEKLKQNLSDSVDYILIDCPPAFNAATAAALIAADDVIIPIKLDAFSLRGMTNIMRQLKNMQAINPRLKVAGILPTMSYRGKHISESIEILRAAEFPVFPSIRRTDKVDDMTYAQKPLIVSSPHSAAAVDYKRFVKQYIEEDGYGI